jgi:putative membrane protein
MNTHSRFLLSSLAVMSCLGGGIAAAGDDTKKNEPVTSSTFVTKAAQNGMAEVELAKAALEKSQDQDVRNFANKMVTDHTKANSELMSIAKRKNVQAPPALDTKHRAMVDQLKNKSGAAFDAAYAQHMAMDHKKALDLFQNASSSQDVDSELSAFAKKSLPTLEEHKRMADKLNARKGGSAQSGNNSSQSDKSHHSSGENQPSSSQESGSRY